MWDVIEAILMGASAAIPGKTGPARSKPAKPSWVGLPVGLFCAAGAAGSVYATFYQNGDRWQIAKLLLLAMVLAFCALIAFSLFAQGRQLVRQRRRLARGQCPRCGYNLRDISSAACPECGSPRLPPGRSIDDPNDRH